MNTAEIARLTTDALVLVLVLSMPPIVVATVVGIVLALVQAITQIQEQTLSFAVKLITVSLVILATTSWLGGELYRFTERVFTGIGQI
jgi:type III secretion HrpO family protein